MRFGMLRIGSDRLFDPTGGIMLPILESGQHGGGFLGHVPVYLR